MMRAAPCILLALAVLAGTCAASDTGPGIIYIGDKGSDSGSAGAKRGPGAVIGAVAPPPADASATNRPEASFPSRPSMGAVDPPTAEASATNRPEASFPSTPSMGAVDPPTAEASATNRRMLLQRFRDRQRRVVDIDDPMVFGTMTGA